MYTVSHIESGWNIYSPPYKVFKACEYPASNIVFNGNSRVGAMDKFTYQETKNDTKLPRLARVL